MAAVEPTTWVGRVVYDIGTMLGAIRQTFRPRYVKYLEREVERLRWENTRLWNSLVGTAGVPPVTLEADPNERGGKVEKLKHRMTWPQYLRYKEEQDRQKLRQDLIHARPAEPDGKPEG